MGRKVLVLLDLTGAPNKAKYTRYCTVFVKKYGVK
jgi:hypothetical protein